MKALLPQQAEYYPTPQWPVRRFLDRVKLPDGLWLEPCVGEGHLCRAVDAWRAEARLPGVTWTTQDIRPTSAAQYVGDYLKTRPPGYFDVGKTNPAFSKAVGVVERMIDQCRHVVILQRLDWMGSAGRRDFFSRTTPDVYVIPEKIAYVNDQTDPANHYAWYHWHEGSGFAELQWLEETPAHERKGTPRAESRQMGMF